MSIDLVYTLKEKRKKNLKKFLKIYFFVVVLLLGRYDYQKHFRGENMNQKLLDLLEYINDILFDESVNINQPEIRQEIKAIVEQVQNELNEEI